MAGLLFVSQALLDTWDDQGRIDFVGNVMTLRATAGQGRSYALEPAVRFLTVLGAERDPHGLVAKVKSHAQLRALGADAVDDSCILDDTAYEVQPGFLAEILPPGGDHRAAGPSAARPGPAEELGGLPGGLPPPCGSRSRREEAEALARFHLEKLS